MQIAVVGRRDAAKWHYSLQRNASHQEATDSIGEISAAEAAAVQDASVLSQA